MIFGYKNKEVSTEGLLEMREVTFAASPEVLREIASFLEWAAVILEKSPLHSNLHRHIGDFMPDWDKRFPCKDIIVTVPAKDPGSNGHSSDS